MTQKHIWLNLGGLIALIGLLGLFYWTSTGARAVPALTESLKDKDSKVRIAAAQQEPVIVSRRLAGVAGALAVAIGLSTWAHLATTLHPDAQGALVYFFLPIYLMGLIPLGYAVGRLAGTLLFKQPAPPA